MPLTNKKAFKEYKRKLNAFGHDILPRVIAETINAIASFAHANSVKNVRQKMTLRNAYTERSIKYYKANPKANILKINAITGSISPYMDEQDLGGEHLPKQGKTVPMPTKAARGGNEKSVVKKQFFAGTLGPNQFVGEPRGISKKTAQRRPKGVYARNKGNKYLVMLRNISSLKIKIDPTHWHTDAMKNDGAEGILYQEFFRQAELELKRLGAT